MIEACNQGKYATNDKVRGPDAPRSRPLSFGDTVVSQPSSCSFQVTYAYLSALYETGELRKTVAPRAPLRPEDDPRSLSQLLGDLQAQAEGGARAADLEPGASSKRPLHVVVPSRVRAADTVRAIWPGRPDGCPRARADSRGRLPGPPASLPACLIAATSSSPDVRSQTDSWSSARRS